jgi:alpha-L-fucosidase
MNKTVLLLLVYLVVFSCSKQEELSYQEGLFEPTWKSLTENYKVPDWYKKGRFGIWVHASPQDEAEAGDWYARNLYNQEHWQYKHHNKKFGHPTEIGYKDVCNKWKLENWNPDAMMKLYKYAGAKFFVGMGNHHCNFDMWDSKYQEWNSKNVGPKRDVLGEWKKSADKYGLRFGTSLHAINTWGWFDTGRGSDSEGPHKGKKYDVATATKESGKGKWWDGLDPQELYGQPHEPGTNGAPPTKEFMLKFYNRFKEVVGKYDIDYLYWDCHYNGVWRQFVRWADTIPSNAERSLRETPLKNMGKTAVAHLYNLSMKKNGGVNQAVTTIKSVPKEFRNALVHDFERTYPSDIQTNVWERGANIGGWHYAKGQFKKKRTAQALNLLVDVISKNGVLLLNVPMSPRGEHDSLAIETLKEIGDWMAINSEAVYNSNPWKKFGNGKLRYTKANGNLYVFIPDSELKEVMKFEDLGTQNLDVTSCKLLGVKESIKWEQSQEDMEIKMPKKLASKHINVLRIKM